MAHFLDSLNEIQQQAARQTEGPVMVIAGPGSGKTRVLTFRIAHMLEKGIDAFNILALTFTNKSAKEMKERIEKMVGTEARNLWMGTFHSVFAKILRFEAGKIGFPSNFTIYDTDDAKSLIKKIVSELNLDPQLYKPNVVYNRISAAKNSLITAEVYKNNGQVRAEDELSGKGKIGEIYSKYAMRCFKAGAMDFDDLLLKMWQLLQEHPDVLYKYQNKFRYIMIDEYQDTNHAQYSIVNLMADMFENICVVGDDAQSIYSFRGANIQNILNFEKDYPEAKIYKLEQNYRSTKKIVEVANKIIDNNKNQLDKTIWTANDDGSRVKVFRGASDNEEGKLVADHIFEEQLRNHYANSDFCILYRTNAQSRSFEEALRKCNIPYKVHGGLSFYQRKEVKDMIGYLRILVNPNDEEAMRRVINYPARGIGKTTMEKVTVVANENELSIWDVLQQSGQLQLNTGTKKKLSDFVNMIKSFQIMVADKDAFEMASFVGRQSGLLHELYADKTVEGMARYENVQELLNSIKEFTTTKRESDDEAIPDDKSLGSYLQEVVLLTDNDSKDEDPNRVKLMTIHSAKGLEFPVVYVAGMEENLFPSMLSLNSRQDLEEERRLFYVAVTRAEKSLNMSFAQTRYRFGNLQYCEPSRFIEEVGVDNLDFVGGRPGVGSARIESKGASSSGTSGARRTVSRGPSVRKPNANHKTSANFKADPPSALQSGMEVEHPKFGFGKLTSIEGPNDNRIATVFFKGAGSKRIMMKFAKLRIVK